MNKSKYSAAQIAKYLVKLSQERSDSNMTPLKLQKLLYYAQGWYIANRDKPLFDDEIQAWRYGPAIYDIYKAYQRYGSDRIQIEDLDNDPDIIEIERDSEVCDFLKELAGKYAKYSGGDLVVSTHSEDPWIEAYPDNIIEVNSIKDYFKERMKYG